MFKQSHKSPTKAQLSSAISQQMPSATPTITTVICPTLQHMHLRPEGIAHQETVTSSSIPPAVASTNNWNMTPGSSTKCDPTAPDSATHTTLTAGVLNMRPGSVAMTTPGNSIGLSSTPFGSWHAVSPVTSGWVVGILSARADISVSMDRDVVVRTPAVSSHGCTTWTRRQQER